MIGRCVACGAFVRSFVRSTAERVKEEEFTVNEVSEATVK